MKHKGSTGHKTGHMGGGKKQLKFAKRKSKQKAIHRCKAAKR